MVVATGIPGQFTGQQQNLEGGPINAAVSKTTSIMKDQASHAKDAGVTMRGGAALTIPHVAEGKTIPGVSFADNHAKLANTLNQLQADKTYDNLAGSKPYTVGGKRKHRRRKTNGRRNTRNSRRTRRKRSNRPRRKHTSRN